jgi:5-formyltetrahydrofolate cyclo-ligase
MLSLRENHPDSERERKSLRIKENLFSLPEFSNAEKILFYVSTKGEVLTKEMIKDSLSLGKKVVVPISNVKEKNLILSELRDFDKELRPSKFGILEPKKQFFREVSPEEIDLVIVPGIAFDRRGNRIGYGMGFYDNFLSNLKKEIPVIALAYEFQIVSEIPTHKKDVRVQKIITEKKVIDCV